MPAFKDITGHRFGRLVVTGRYDKNRHGNITWLCKCDCGREHIVLGKILTSGRSRSCGCLPSKNFLHGKTNSPEWHSWNSMHKRCCYSKDKDYKRYGGRGIIVCERWQTFENFLTDMGKRPDGYTLDRINTNGNYEPSNCRWATPRQQANNRRYHRYLPRLFLGRGWMWYLRHANDNPTKSGRPSSTPFD